MPVVVQCFHCNAILELDDGFRGGVCRCSTCGSLLQVPKAEIDAPPKAKRVRPAVPPGPSSPVKTEDSGISSGALDPRRADSGISSGLVHKTSPIAMTAAKPSRTASAPPPPPAAPPKQHRPRTPQERGALILSLIMIFLIAAVLAAVIYVIVRQFS